MKNKLENRITVLIRREQRLLSIYGNTEFRHKQQKCARLANEAWNERMKCESKWYELVEKEKLQQLQDDNKIVLLSCHSHSCWETGVGMTVKAYYAQDHFCEKCGRQLFTEQEWENKIELLKIGVIA